MQSESVKEITTALVKVQKGLQSVKPDATNPHYKSKFTTLDAIWDVIRQPLAEAGLAVSQGVDRGANDQPYFYTLLLHTSGEWLRSEMPLLLDKQTAQGIGSAITYSRRYSLAAMVGITQDDDDGNAASGKDENKTSSPAPASAPRPAPAPKPGPAPAGTPAPKGGQDARAFADLQNEINGCKTLVDLDKIMNDKVEAGGFEGKPLESLRKLGGMVARKLGRK